MNLRITPYEANSSMKPHLHHESSFVVVAQGSYQECIRNTTNPLTQGHMLFYPAFSEHAQQIGPQGALKIVWTPSTSTLELLRESKLALSEAPHCGSTVLSQLAARVLNEAAHTDSFSSLALEGLLLEMAGEFGRSCLREQSSQPPQWLRAVRDFLLSADDRNASHNEIASLCGKHPVHIAKQFRRYYGTTLGGFQRSLRLDKAKSLMQQKSMSIAEIAVETGFASQAHLTRCFKDAYGTTPGQYRDRSARPRDVAASV